jgi:pimeloyl-ACP methyl ester carboxylesterase
VRRGYVDTSVGQLHFRELGSGEPLVLLHKTPSSSVQFERCAPLLAGSRRVVAFDTPGFGSSDPPAEPPTIADYAGALVEGTEALGLGAVDLVGHHTGASIAVEIAATRPELVRRLVLAGILAFARPEDREPWQGYLRRFDLDARGEYLDVYPLPLLHEWLERDDPEQFHDELVAYLQAGNRYWWSYEAVLAHDAYARFPQIVAPTLFLNQERGRVRDSTIAAHEACPGSAYEELAGTSEGAMDDPESFAAAVRRFLDSSS